MNNNNLQFQGVSENLKYIFTNKGIITTSSYFSNEDNRFIDYSIKNLPFAVDIIREHKEVYYKLNKISLVEYVNSSRKFLYQIMEVFQPDNQLTILKEWENNYGSKLVLLNESVDTLLIENRVNESWSIIKSLLIEAWYNPFSWDWKGAAQRAGKWVGDTAKGVVDWTKEQGRQIAQKGVLGWAADKAKSVWNSVKNAVSKAWNCLTNNFVECLMEGLRSAAFSAVGMGVMTLITFVPGVGQVADVLVFGSLLIWDVYKMLSGKYESGEYQWSWADIIVDGICMLLPALGAAFKAAAGGIRTASELGVAAATKGGIFAKVLSAFKNGIGKVVSLIGKAAEWIGEKLGITWLKNFGSKAQNFITKEVEVATKTAESKGGIIGKAKTRGQEALKGAQQFTKDFKFIKPTPVVIKSTGKTIIITGALCAALGLDGWRCKHKIESGEVSEAEIQQAQKSLQSGKFQEQLNQLSVADAEQLGLF